jgi:catechol 2,3-dioxygenase-like lactoylglutathione lyase family enzyme
MIDHTGVNVSNFARSRAFYIRALAPLGYELIKEFPPTAGAGAAVAVEDSTQVAGFGQPPMPDFWIASGKPNVPPVHIAIRARARALVDAFHAAAIAAGGRDNGGPGVRAHYHAGYYGAFVLDPDGHNIEAVCHGPA